MKNKKKGFTLVELLVVIAILAVLASVSVVGYVGFTTKAKQSACLQEAKQIQTTILAELVDGKTLEQGGLTATLKDNKLIISGSVADDNFVALFTGLKELNDPNTKEFSYDTTNGLTYTSNGFSCNITFDGSELTVK